MMLQLLARCHLVHCECEYRWRCRSAQDFGDAVEGTRDGGLSESRKVGILGEKRDN